MHATVRNGRLCWPVPGEIHRPGDQPILSVQRCTKCPLLELTDGWIIIHPDMSGSPCTLSEEPPAGEHNYVGLVVSNGKALYCTDPRHFGAWLWTKELDGYNVPAHFGPEPLSDDLSVNHLQQGRAKKKTTVKSQLMDNKLVVDVGNIYANESLFVTGIHPDRLTSLLSKDECKLLIHVIKAALPHSIEQDGATLRDFLQSDGKLDHFTQELQVYGRGGESCRACGTPIVVTKHAQRTMSYYRRCQKQSHCWPDTASGQMHYFSLPIDA